MKALALAVLLASPPARAAERPKIAVLDLVDQGAGKDVAQSLTDVVAVALAKLGVFDVLSRADIVQMLEFEQQRQILGCESDASCLAELGGALGVGLLVTGSVGRVGGRSLLLLTLSDTSAGKVLAREQRQVARDADLAAETGAAARFLVRGLLAGRQGDLILRVAENGADVEIDGHIVGVTPLPRLTLGGGPHTVRISKQGFISWARDIDIAKGEAHVVEAALVPSLEFIRGYDERAGTWRTLAYLTGGAGVAAIAFAVGGWVWNSGRIDAYERDLTAASCAENTPTPPTTACAEFAERRDEIRRFDVITEVAGGVGAVSLAVGVYLFTQGPEPGIYDAYKGAEVSLIPVAGGALAAAHWRF